MLGPTIDAIAEQFAESAGVVKVSVDDNTSTAQRYGIKGIPTLILFSAGKEVERVVGATSKESISRANCRVGRWENPDRHYERNRSAGQEVQKYCGIRPAVGISLERLT